MSERFYISELNDRASVTIEGDEARHISRVMRMKVGDQVVLFDGSDRQSDARITEIHKNRVELAVLGLVDLSREPSTKVTIATALPKGDRLKFMIEKLTELGVSRLVPVVFERSSVIPKDNTIEKIKRYVVEASKQCERNRLMTVLSPTRSGDLFNGVFPNGAIEKQPGDADDEPGPRIVCCPHVDLGMVEAMKSADQNPSATICFCIGPEGGITEKELKQAIDAGWTAANFGPRILRTETAAIFASALAIGKCN